MPSVLNDRLPGPDGEGPDRGAGALLRMNATQTLGAFFTVGGLMCWAAVALPHDPAVQTAAVGAVGALILTVGVALLLARRVSSAIRAALAAVSSLCLGVLVDAAHGTGEGLAFAAFVVWIMVYSALFFRRRLAAAQAVLGTAAVSLAWAHSGGSGSDVLLVVAAALTTALVVGDLVHHTRAAADRDPLTGLLTRRGLERGVVALNTAARRADGPTVVLLLEIRGLGQVNESLGHAAGDELLSRVGAVLLPATRTEVLGARLASDRLAAVLSPAAIARMRAALVDSGTAATTATDVAVWAARSTLQVIRGPHPVAGVAVLLEGRVGVVVADQPGDGLAALLRAGEVALAEAARRDTAVQVYDSGLASAGAEQLQLLAELRDAVPGGQLRVHYQVQVAAGTRRPVSVEALVRWQHPRRGFLSPGTFLPVAETTDVIVDLTWWVLDEVLRQSARWLAAGYRVPVSVNLSARLLTHADLLEGITDRVRDHGVPGDLLTLEVTETALVAHPARAAEVLTALRAHGMRTSLDDFGTGQTSLALLADLPFDELKIDQRFVSAGLTDRRAAAVVRSVLHLGHGLQQLVVAEGIEDDATARWLSGLGCDVLQGYHFGRPVAAASLTDLPRPAPYDPLRIRGRVVAARR